MEITKGHCVFYGDPVGATYRSQRMATLNNFNFGFDWTNQKDNTSVRLGEPFSVLRLFDRNTGNVF